MKKKAIVFGISLKIWILTASGLFGQVASPTFFFTPTFTPSPTFTTPMTFTATPTRTIVFSPTSSAGTLANTSTPTNSSTNTPTQTSTNTPAPTGPTAIIGSPTFSPTPLPTSSGCVSYFDNFSNANTLSNYDYFMNSSQALTTASGAGYQITGGFFEVAPPASTNNGGMAVVNDAN